MAIKKVIKKFIPLLLIFSLLIGNAYCYISTTDSQTETLSVGAVSFAPILSTSTTLRPDYMFFTDAEINTASFGSSIIKQIQFKNTGTVSVRGFLVVRIPLYDAPYLDSSNVEHYDGPVPVLYYTATAHWTLLRIYTEDNYITYLYGTSRTGRDEIIQPNVSTLTLCGGMSVRNFTKTLYLKPDPNNNNATREDEYLRLFLRGTTFASYAIPATYVSSNENAVAMLPSLFQGDSILSNVCTLGVAP